jgi:NAD(P)-dependent dehydrogenase (short-subunit alcohol dehydrogenase family)
MSPRRQTQTDLEREMETLKGKVAIVTGAGQGIGTVVARRFASEGARVVIADINQESSQQVARLIEQEGGTAIGVSVDVTHEEQVRALMEATVSEYGGLDILHNNAALTTGIHAADQGIATIDRDFWDKTFAINLTGTFLCCKHAIPRMIERGGGAIINTSSLHALRNNVRLPAYSASKAGVCSLSRSIAVQYGKRGIRANSLVLGMIVTERSRKVMGTSDTLTLMADHHLTPFVGEPKHVAATAVFLASDESEFITGQEIWVDGGMSVHAADVGDARRGINWLKEPEDA